MNPLMLNRRLETAEGDGGGGGGGGGAPGPAPTTPWHGEFAADAPQDFKDWVANKGFKDPQSALYSAFNQEKLIGAEKAGRTVLWPKDENDKDGWKSIYSKLGVPGKPEEYGLAAGKDDDANLVSAFATALHANNIPKAAAAGLFSSMQQTLKDMAEAQSLEAQQKSKTEMEALDKEWGTAAAGNKELARRFARELGITAEQMNAVENALGTATFMKMFHAGGAKLGELKGEPGGGGGQFGYTRDQARAKLDAARIERSEGKISAEQWQKLFDELAPIANAA